MLLRCSHYERVLGNWLGLEIKQKIARWPSKTTGLLVTPDALGNQGKVQVQEANHHQALKYSNIETPDHNWHIQ